MPAFILPDLDRLRDAPERGPLALLLAALDVADSALRLEHPRLDFVPQPPFLPPATELIAELLMARFEELATLLARYSDAVDNALGQRDANQRDLF
jgi:hypothetical protein